MGGAFKRPPPPSRRWEIQRPSRARVKLLTRDLANTTMVEDGRAVIGEIDIN